jgi:ABC-2 type transport system ATP-binding protein
VTWAIETVGLTKRYGRTLALDGLDLRVEQGEVYGYLGPNGAARRRRSGSCSDSTEPLPAPPGCSMLSLPSWIARVTPFAQIGLFPAAPFRVDAALAMAAIGVGAGAGALALFRHRDLVAA